MDFLVSHEQYDDFLLSFWSQNLEFAHHHCLPASLASVSSCTFPYTLPVPSLLFPPPVLVWLSVLGIMAPRVDVGGLIPGPVNGGLSPLTGFPYITILFLAPVLFCPKTPLLFCPETPLLFCPKTALLFCPETPLLFCPETPLQAALSPLP